MLSRELFSRDVLRSEQLYSRRRREKNLASNQKQPLGARFPRSRPFIRTRLRFVRRREGSRPLEQSETRLACPTARARFAVVEVQQNFHITHKKAARATAIGTATASSATGRGTGPAATRATDPAAETAARGKNSRGAGGHGRRRRTNAARGARAAARARAGAPRRRRR